MFARVMFTFKHAIIYRKNLQKLQSESSIFSIDWRRLYDSGIRVVVLDFDGVLAADHEEVVSPQVGEVLENILMIFGRRVYIFSNRPTDSRRDYFKKHFPGICFLIAKQKPYPDGLLSIITAENVSAGQVVLVDDRLLTGGLATVLAGTHCIIIDKPFASFRRHLWRELFFASLRSVERFWCHKKASIKTP
ncbi:MAG: hypothetical protein LRY67_06730 [Gammaproteobacteria bacterium]|nr:hypothetical protein [Gammaproteobacteria bacterium]MCD8542528.1 hypothetical protein [Gammaproteobacteria bacterium]